jgi:hypothetical protein
VFYAGGIKRAGSSATRLSLPSAGGALWAIRETRGPYLCGRSAARWCDIGIFLASSTRSTLDPFRTGVYRGSEFRLRDRAASARSLIGFR